MRIFTFLCLLLFPLASGSSSVAFAQASAKWVKNPENYDLLRQFGERGATALAVGKDDGTLYLAGSGKLVIIQKEKKMTPLQIPIKATALAFCEDFYSEDADDNVILRRLYIVGNEQALVYDPEELSKPLATWKIPQGEKGAVVTSATCDDTYLYVADAANKVVWRFGGDEATKTDGKPFAIGLPDKKKNALGFIITNQWFDIAVDPTSGLVCAVNPRRLMIEKFTSEGYCEASFKPKDARGGNYFFGCCNPAHLAAFDDGRLATLEKGEVRMSLFSKKGEFLEVVASPKELGKKIPRDIACYKGKIYVLEAEGNSVSVREQIKP